MHDLQKERNSNAQEDVYFLLGVGWRGAVPDGRRIGRGLALGLRQLMIIESKKSYLPGPPLLPSMPGPPIIDPSTPRTRPVVPSLPCSAVT